MAATVLWIILALVLVSWLLGVVAHIGGDLINLLLVVALVLLIYNLFVGRRVVT